MPTAHANEPDFHDSSTDHRPLVLLAEDDDELRAVLSDDLKRLGLRVTAVASGHALRAKWRALRGKNATPIGLIVTDVRLPGVSGLDFLAELRGEDWTVPVVVMSGFLDLESTDEALRLGATSVLSKPFELLKFRSEVRRVLGMAALPRCQEPSFG